MILKKSANGQWAKAGEDIKDGDIVTILDEGTETEGEYGAQIVFKIRTASGEERILSFNKTSRNNLIDAYGEDTSQWVNKEAHAEVVKAMVSGSTKWVVVLSGTMLF